MKAVADRVGSPRPTLGLTDAVALIVGIVVGAGIFETPALVAANTGGPLWTLLAWLLGGGISLIGALCYAELTTAYPHAGGNYYYLLRAFGRDLAFLYAWARLAVVQTGSIALLAFVSGDYASQLWRLGEYSPSIYAALVIALFTALNIAGIRQGARTQNLLAVATVLGLAAVIVGGLLAPAPAQPLAAPAPASTNFGLAMVFVLLTYGGWNEAAYISAELRSVKRNMVRALLVSIGIITALYLLANVAFIHALGTAGMAGSQAVAADLMRRVAGAPGAAFISALIVVCALSSANASIITGGRTNYALGQDFTLFRFLGRWRTGTETPANALAVQGVIALGLVVLGTATRGGFKTMVEYTAPVFWLFFLLTGAALLVLRSRDPQIERPFRVPLYPLTPLLFCLICGYMLQASLAYTGTGALVGVAVLLVGLPLLWIARRTRTDS
ncbi:APC family permease [Gloeobacter violaceus]|uniref:Gll1652 protein n=1 Tax=Gloeobacter violaceus (strain ATCC 29082 / PCC 7421) TaxID=251221 RepID=Q7NK28_GLOVI|nr:amino acid permease [Gloeobacter violaceus]BAC89593.1 gll1652 [Gloeobacter violaceus PCC 7421]